MLRLYQKYINFSTNQFLRYSLRYGFNTAAGPVALRPVIARATIVAI